MMASFPRIILFCAACFLPARAFSQDSTITVKGKVVQHPAIGFTDFMIINASSGRGIFGNADGTFEIKIQPRNIIKISCHGFNTETVSFKDSVYKPVYNITVAMNQLLVQIKPVVVRPEVTQEQLKEAQSRIGIHRYVPMVNNPADAIFHPLTALYQKFSKKEQEKREYAELMNEYEKEQTLKDITRYHIQMGLFELDEEELALFIATCPMTREFVQHASLYDISVELSKCYDVFKAKRRY